MLPVIVIDGHLVDAHLDETQDIIVSTVDSGVLDWNNPVAGHAPTWLRVVTIAALDAFIADARRTADYLEHHCPDVLADIDKRWLGQSEHRRASLPPSSSPAL